MQNLILNYNGFLDHPAIYEAYNRKTFMNSITLQPLVADQAFMPHMEAMYVPFQMRYGNLTCYKGLHSERPKC